jgi:hypothetical protein
MSFLKPATDSPTHLKAGILGFAGSGKTFTASKIAIGLHRFIKSEKPIAFLDTETGASYVLPLFKAEKIPVVTARTRAYTDLLAVTREAEKTCDILIVDSITHFYNELIKGYQKKLNRDRLRIWDWAPIKAEWSEFADLYINSKLHILMLGRAGWEYEEKEDEDGVTQAGRSGTKMKVETDFGYEPSLSIETERVRRGTGKIGQDFVYRSWVLKDRFNLINGRCFDFDERSAEDATNPVFKSFLPHIKSLNIGGDAVTVDTAIKSDALFTAPDSRTNIHKRREIALESIQNEITKRISGRSAKDSQAKIKILEDIFGTNSWTAISDLHPERLEGGLKKIQETKIESEVANA